MKNIMSKISIVVLSLSLFSCAEKEKVDTSQAPEEIVQAIEISYQLSKELTDLQLNAANDKVLDQTEIEQIGKVFRKLAIVNNINLKLYQQNKYFVALSKERKADFNELAEKVTILKDCSGYDELGLEVQKISLEVKDVIELPIEEVVVEEVVPVAESDTVAVELE